MTVHPILVHTVTYLRDKDHLATEGIFRVCSDSQFIKTLYEDFYDETDFSGLTFESPHDAASLLKYVLRKEPPLLTEDMYNDFIDAGCQASRRVRAEMLRELVSRLPESNRENLEFVLPFFREVTDLTNHNLMSISNISVVLGPLLLSPPSSPMDNDSQFMSNLLKDVEPTNRIASSFLMDFVQIFDQETPPSQPTPIALAQWERPKPIAIDRKRNQKILDRSPTEGQAPEQTPNELDSICSELTEIANRLLNVSKRLKRTR